MEKPNKIGAIFILLVICVVVTRGSTTTGSPSPRTATSTFTATTGATAIDTDTDTPAPNHTPALTHSPTPTPAPAPTHSPTPAPRACNTLTSCETCLANVSCLWCQTNATCMDYPVSFVIPPSSVCKLSQARWGVCWVNFEALIIAMGVVGGVLALAIIVCCCCCCYRCGRCRGSSGLDVFEEEYIRKRGEIRQRSDERKAERKTRHDEIRKKYGLIPDSDHPYSKFESE